MTTTCDSCGSELTLSAEGRFPWHQGLTARGMCGASELLPLGGAR